MASAKPDTNDGILDLGWLPAKPNKNGVFY